MGKELKLTFSVNNKELPLKSVPTFTIDKNGDYVVTFAVGANKLDNIKLKFKEVEYIKDTKDK